MNSETKAQEGLPAGACSVEMGVLEMPISGCCWYIHVRQLNGFLFPALVWVEIWESGPVYRTPSGYRSINFLGVGTWFELPLSAMAKFCAPPNDKLRHSAPAEDTKNTKNV